ncbi:MAG: hypothetical protein NC402_04660 [Prevotella sp.]|nr:hypothetical protein [Prevotella sp.]MCM1075023.1 hypothetical protein [Ruminococcus sp.]
MDKRKEMTDWLKANPGKSKRDWLLEVRCNSNADREAMAYLLDKLDKADIKYGICVEHSNYHKRYQVVPMNESERFFFDLTVTPEVPKMAMIVETDMPENALGQVTKDKNGEEIPEVAYRWLLKKWFPSFNIDAQDEKTRSKLLWEDTSGLFGQYRFFDWKNKDFVDEYVSRIVRLRG